MGTDKAEYYKAKHAFGVMLDGEQVTVAEGDIVPAGHELLNGRDEHFEPVEYFGRWDRPVEQATNNPGKGREVTPADPYKGVSATDLVKQAKDRGLKLEKETGKAALAALQHADANPEEGREVTPAEGKGDGNLNPPEDAQIVSYDGLDLLALQTICGDRGVTAEGTGEDGAVTEDDYRLALMEADEKAAKGGTDK